MRLFQRDEEVCMAIMVLFLALVWVWPIYRNEVSSNPSWHFLASTRRLIWINSKRVKSEFCASGEDKHEVQNGSDGNKGKRGTLL